jgi:hypothetical protein
LSVLQLRKIVDAFENIDGLVLSKEALSFGTLCTEFRPGESVAHYACGRRGEVRPPARRARAARLRGRRRGREQRHPVCLPLTRQEDTNDNGLNPNNFSNSPEGHIPVPIPYRDIESGSLDSTSRGFPQPNTSFPNKQIRACTWSASTDKHGKKCKSEEFAKI